MRSTICVVVVTIGMLGCNDGPVTGDISGTVTVNGNPLPYGTIGFLGSSGASGSGVIQDGKYMAKDVPIGEYKIVIQSLQVPPMVVIPGEQTTKDNQPSPKRFISLPQMFTDPEKSGLATTIEEGEQKYDIPIAVSGGPTRTGRSSPFPTVGPTTGR